MADDGHEYGRDRDYGRSSFKRGGSPPMDQDEYERPRRRVDDYNYKSEDRGYRSGGFGGYRGPYEGSYIPHGQYVAINRLIDRRFQQAREEQDRREYKEPRSRLPPPPPPARRSETVAATPTTSADRDLIDQLAEEKAARMKLEEEVQQLRSMKEKLKAQQKRKKARQQQKKAAAAASSSDEEHAPEQTESAAETASEKLAELSFKDVLVNTAGRRRKSSPAALDTTQESDTTAPGSIPFELASKLIGMKLMTKASVEKVIGDMYKGQVANLRPLWHQLMPDKELPSTKAAALTELYQVIRANISSLKG